VDSIPVLGEGIDTVNCVGGDGWSCAGLLVPLAGGKLLGAAARVRAGSKFGDLLHAGTHGIRPYRVQQLVTTGHKSVIQAHHLIEQRFARIVGQAPGDMASVVLTHAEHVQFTNAWANAIPRGTTNVTVAQVHAAARQIYADYPEFIQALGL
jgi:hypothetical protein